MKQSVFIVIVPLQWKGLREGTEKSSTTDVGVLTVVIENWNKLLLGFKGSLAKFLSTFTIITLPISLLS